MLTLRFAPSSEVNPFRTWVPYWLKVVVAFAILCPIMLINGAYTGSNIDISGSLGVMSEDINLAYYMTSAGMAVAYLVIHKVKPIATTKTIILVVLLFQLALSFICAYTPYIEVIIVCSFLIGYFKAFSLVETFHILIPVLGPSGTRNEFYAKFYPITLALGQLSLVLTGELAYMYKWQYMYYFMILLLLVAIVFVVICMAYARRLVRLPFKDIDWLSLFLVSLCYMCVIYVATYGKIENWFESPYILLGTVIAVVSGWLFFVRQLADDERVDMSVLKNRNAMSAYILSFLMMFFASFSILLSSYTSSILHLENTRMTDLYLYMIPGIVAGGFVCYYGYLKEIRMAWLIFIGFACFTLSIGILYFRIAPEGVYSDLIMPMFLRGVGTMVLFASLSIYAVYSLTDSQMLYNAFFIISFRSTLAPAIGSSIISNWLYRAQQEKMSTLMIGVDAHNPIATSQFNATVSQSLAKGLSIEEAHQLATQALYAKVHIQATTISIKEILGWMLILSLIVLAIILLYFFQFKPVKLLKTGSDMSG